MIIPTTRLILFAAVILPPFAALAAMWPPAAMIAALLASGLAVVALLDALRAPAVLRALRVEAPPFARLHKGREGSFELRFVRDAGGPRSLRVGCALPAAFDSREEVRDVRLPAGADVATVAWPCLPRERGLFHPEALVLETTSPLGLWAWRERREIAMELRVHPDLLAERQRVAALFLRRGMLGAHTQRRAGQGREFEKLRDYLPGDSLGDVHWKASAKRSHLVTKIHQIERTHEVYVVIDASRLSARVVEADERVPALERYVTAALILGAAAERQGDQFGLITFSDRVLTFLRARNGQGHFDTCRDKLYTLQPQPVTPDFDDLCAFLRTRLNKRALVIFLTALDDPFLAESFVNATQLIARQHLILVNMMRPPGVRPVFENADVKRLDDLYRELGGHLQWEKLRELERVLRRRGIRFSLLDPLMIAAQLVKQHAEVRQRELV
ncbi:MAG: DUF58 domain-containing protein [Chthoniobacteraceae bacterium]